MSPLKDLKSFLRDSRTFRGNLLPSGTNDKSEAPEKTFIRHRAGSSRS